MLLQLPTLPSPLRNASSQATLVLLLTIGAGAALATEDQQQRLDLEQEQLLTRLPWLLLHPPTNMSCVSAACALISFEAPSAPAPGATLPPPSVAPAELPPAPEGPPAHSSPAPGGAQPPPFDPEEEEELQMVRPCVVCVIARWPPGRSPVSAVTEYILNKADMENGDPMGMLESVLYCDEHSVTLL